MPFRKTYIKYGIFSTKGSGSSAVSAVAAAVLMLELMSWRSLWSSPPGKIPAVSLRFSPTLPARPVLVGERGPDYQSPPEPPTVKMSLSVIKLLLVLVVLFICSIERAESRPRAHIVGNHIMKQQRNHERKISNNKTGKKWRQTKHIKHKNRNLIKALLAFQDDYEEYEYDSPIIEIRFKREASLEDVKTDSLMKNILQQEFLYGKNSK